MEVEHLRAEVEELENAIVEASANGSPPFYVEKLERDKSKRLMELQQAMLSTTPNGHWSEQSSGQDRPAIARIEEIRGSIRELEAAMATPGMPPDVIQFSQAEVNRLEQEIAILKPSVPAALANSPQEDPEIAALEAQLTNTFLPASVREVLQKALDEKRAAAYGGFQASESPLGSDMTANGQQQAMYPFLQAHSATNERFVTPPGSDVGSSVSAAHRQRYSGLPDHASMSQGTINMHELDYAQRRGTVSGPLPHQSALVGVQSTYALSMAAPVAAMTRIQSAMGTFGQSSEDMSVQVSATSAEAPADLSNAEQKLNDKKAKLGSNAQDLRIAAVQHKARELDAYAADREKRLDRYQQDLDQAVIRARDAKQVYRALMDSEDEDLETKKRKDAKIVQLNSESNELDKEIRKGNEAVGALQGSIQTRKLEQQGKLFGKKKFDAWLADAKDQVAALDKKLAECKSEKSRKQEEISKLSREIEAMREKHSEAQHRRAKLRYEEAQREVLELEDRMDKFQESNKAMLNSNAYE